jgi:hypothetical protein
MKCKKIVRQSFEGTYCNACGEKGDFGKVIFALKKNILARRWTL